MALVGSEPGQVNRSVGQFRSSSKIQEPGSGFSKGINDTKAFENPEPQTLSVFPLQLEGRPMKGNPPFGGFACEHLNLCFLQGLGRRKRIGFGK